MYIQLDSQVLYYEKEGEGDPLILLHGNGEDHTIFDTMIPHLVPHFTVYSLDSRGCGLSSPSTEYHYEDMASDVAKLINAIDIGRPSILGFSDGGIIALLCAIHHPKLVDKLIICGANTSPKGLTFKGKHLIKSEYRKTKSDMVKMMLREPDITDAQLSQIRSRTLVFAGEKDIIKPSDTKKIASLIQDAKLDIIPGADHSSYIIHSDMIAPKVVDFLK